MLHLRIEKAQFSDISLSIDTHLAGVSLIPLVKLEKQFPNHLLLLDEPKKRNGLKVLGSQSCKYFSTNFSKQLRTTDNSTSQSYSLCVSPEAKKLSHIKSVNEMSGKDVYAFSENSDYYLLKI